MNIHISLKRDNLIQGQGCYGNSFTDLRDKGVSGVEIQSVKAIRGSLFSISLEDATEMRYEIVHFRSPNVSEAVQY